MSIENIPANQVEVLSPAEEKLVSSMMRRITTAVELSPWEKYRLDWRMRRERDSVLIQLARMETETVVAETLIAAKGRISASLERAAVLHLKEQLRCMQAAGEALDDSINASTTLTENSRELIQGAMYRVVQNYARGVEKRAGRLV